MPGGAIALQLLSYAVLGMLGYRPLKRWLERRSRPPGSGFLLRDAAGLTTIEYTILFVLIVIGELASGRALDSRCTRL